MSEEDLTVTTTTIHKHLDGQSYTLKKVVVEPFTMNVDINKEKRADYSMFDCYWQKLDVEND